MGDHEAHGSEGLIGPGEVGIPVVGGNAADAADAAEAARRLFAQECAFVAGAARLDQIPGGRLPEVAFAGRSNVGKSSLINALTGRRTLANVSATPGRTRQVNFFNLAGRLMLVDLPGYGYAAAPKQQVAAWTRLIEDYLVGRAELRRVMLLIDGRHGIKDADQGVMQLLDRAAVAYQVVLTKCDALAAAVLEQRIDAVGRQVAEHTAAHPLVLASSARTGAGVPELRTAVARLADVSAEVE